MHRSIVDRYIRRKAKLHQTPLDRFRVEAAHRLEQYDDAFRLIHAAYVAEGIEPVRSPELRIFNQHVLPESTVFVAYEGDQIVGTLTVTLDSRAGLPLDADYPADVAALRAGGARIVEYGALTVVRRCWHSGVNALLSNAAHWFSWHVLNASHCVIGVNPRAEPFFRAMWGFEQLGVAQSHAQLVAPVVGLVQHLDRVRDHLERHFRRRMSTGLYPYEHYCDALPLCIEMPPPGSPEQLARWKLPREVFQELFMRRSDRLSTLDSRTREHLSDWRSLRTLVEDTEHRQRAFQLLNHRA